MDQEQTPSLQGLICPLPHTHSDTVVIGHGSGGSMTHDLIQSIFQSQFENEILAEGNDAARLSSHGNLKGELALSTDSHVVSPLFFRGGDIGRLAVAGTVNDIAMLGARPYYLTAGFIIEEGFPMKDLKRIVNSMAEACHEAGVQIVAGDTKVVERGKVDGLFINTTGIGVIPQGIKIGGQNAKPGDAVLISGSLGEHSIAVLEARGELGFESGIESDLAPLNHLVSSLLNEVPDIHVLRDPTRGGLATSLNEIACQSKVTIRINEADIPVLSNVRIACEMLGFDPLYLANEGKAIIILPQDKVEIALKHLRKSPYGASAELIGTVTDEDPGRVLMTTPFGTTRIITMLAGEILPRIC